MEERRQKLLLDSFHHLIKTSSPMSKKIDTIRMSPLKSNAMLYVLVLILALSWGYSWPLMKIGLAYIEPFTFTFLRFIIGGVTLILFISIFQKGTSLRFPASQWKHLVIFGMVQTFAVFGLITYAMLFIDAGKTSIILYTMPIWTSILAAIFLKENLSSQNIIGLIFGVIGLGLIIGEDIYYDSTANGMIGIILILIASILWAFANIYFRLYLKEQPQLPITAYQMLLGSIGLGVCAFIFERGSSITWNIASIYAILFTGVIASALCFSLWYYLLRNISTITAAISTLLVPVFAVLFGYWMLEEPLSISMLIGGGFVVFGIFISQAHFKKIPFFR